MQLIESVYQLAGKLPKVELYALSSQIKRAAISIPSNIAEGRSRGTRKEYRQFLTIAYGSAAELETQLEIARRLNFCEDHSHQKVDGLLVEVKKMLSKLITSLKPDT